MECIRYRVGLGVGQTHCVTINNTSMIKTIHITSDYSNLITNFIVSIILTVKREIPDTVLVDRPATCATGARPGTDTSCPAR